MADKLTPERRSDNMRRVKGRDTKPEILVRSLVHRMGFRFRLHRSDLPGRPDLAFSSRKAVIFVHGCFWHQHKGCNRATLPQTNTAFWVAKLSKNAKRDEKQLRELRAGGWRTLVIWECETKDVPRLSAKLKRFLNR